MTTKLTLSMDERVIGRAKRIAKGRGKSLSKMVEEYFNSIPEKKHQEDSVVERIEKRIKPYLNKINLPEDKDYRELIREWKYQDYLKQKGRSK
jgi:hypothetical protein